MDRLKRTMHHYRNRALHHY